jgi:hypothetical protein
MIEFFTKAILQPNFDKIQKPVLSQAEMTQTRLISNPKITANNSPMRSYEQFISKRDKPNPITPKTEVELDNNDQEVNQDNSLKPNTTKESKQVIGQWLRKNLRTYSKEIRDDIKVCNTAGGGMVVVSSSGGEAEIRCISNNGKELEIDIQGKPPAVVEQLANLGVEAKIGLVLVTNKYGKLVIGYTQENFPASKKILLNLEGFILREKTTYVDFFQQIQTEMAKQNKSLAKDVMRCNLKNQNASLNIENLNGVLKIVCQNQNGQISSINFNKLNAGTKKLVTILNEASKKGYNTSLILDPKYSTNQKFKIQPLYKN